MEFFSKSEGIPVSLAILASLVAHACLLAVPVRGGVTANESGVGLHVRLAAERTDKTVAKLAKLATVVAKATDAPKIAAASIASAGVTSVADARPQQQGAAISSEYKFGFDLIPPVTQEMPPVSDPVQSALRAQRRQYQMQAISMELAEVVGRLSTEATGETQCRQQPNLVIRCETDSKEAQSELLTQWLELLTQARNLGMSSAEQDLRGTRGHLVVHLL